MMTRRVKNLESSLSRFWRLGGGLMLKCETSMNGRGNGETKQRAGMEGAQRKSLDDGMGRGDGRGKIKQTMILTSPLGLSALAVGWEAELEGGRKMRG